MKRIILAIGASIALALSATAVQADHWHHGGHYNQGGHYNHGGYYAPSTHAHGRSHGGYGRYDARGGTYGNYASPRSQAYYGSHVHQYSPAPSHAHGYYAPSQGHFGYHGRNMDLHFGF